MTRLFFGLALVCFFEAAQAQQIKVPVTDPGSGFGQNSPDVIGINFNTPPLEAKNILTKHFASIQSDQFYQEWSFGQSEWNIKYPAMITHKLVAGTDWQKATFRGDDFRIEYSAPPSGNRARFIARTMNFNDHAQPTYADFVKQILSKYGTPTAVANGAMYYFYRNGQLASGRQLSAEEALAALSQNAAPETIKQFGPCFGISTQVQAPYPQAALLNSCEASIAIQFVKGISAERVQIMRVTMIDLKRLLSSRRIDQEGEEAIKNQLIKNTPTGNVPKL